MWRLAECAKVKKGSRRQRHFEAADDNLFLHAVSGALLWAYTEMHLTALGRGMAGRRGFKGGFNSEKGLQGRVQLHNSLTSGQGPCQSCIHAITDKDYVGVT